MLCPRVCCHCHSSCPAGFAARPPYRPRLAYRQAGCSAQEPAERWAALQGRASTAHRPPPPPPTAPAPNALCRANKPGNLACLRPCSGHGVRGVPEPRRVCQQLDTAVGGRCGARQPAGKSATLHMPALSWFKCFQGLKQGQQRPAQGMEQPAPAGSILCGWYLVVLCQQRVCRTLSRVAAATSAHMFVKSLSTQQQLLSACFTFLPAGPGRCRVSEQLRPLQGWRGGHVPIHNR